MLDVSRYKVFGENLQHDEGPASKYILVICLNIYTRTVDWDNISVSH